MKKKISLSVISVVVGVFFIVSGAGKIVNSDGFASTLQSYGLSYFSYAAPLISVGEIVLGLLMLLLVNQKRYALYSLITLFVFTGAFAYAYFFRKVDECGCFGEIRFLNSSATVSFIRNGVLMICCLMVFIFSSKKIQPTRAWKRVIIYTASILAMGLGGFTMSSPLVTSTPFENQTIEKTPLINYFKPNSDSTYLVVVFSYACSHCWDATENIKQYVEAKAVSRVLGIAFGNSPKQALYYSCFNPNFQIATVPADSITKLTQSFPVAFFIKNNKIQRVMKGTISSPHTLKHLFSSHSQ
jgi:uncharacterized membrane protein YphA (DoxX/SURF4 family)